MSKKESEILSAKVQGDLDKAFIDTQGKDALAATYFLNSAVTFLLGAVLGLLAREEERKNIGKILSNATYGKFGHMTIQPVGLLKCEHMHKGVCDKCFDDFEKFNNSLKKPEAVKHPHSDLMIAYAIDSQFSDIPWKWWQYKCNKTDHTWLNPTQGLLFVPDYTYRRSPVAPDRQFNYSISSEPK